ncbi:MAG: hypothetical protein ABL958_16225, partial [Bdellovibrionia bacterium]
MTKNRRDFLLVFSFSLTVFGLYLVIFWPGLHTWDGIVYLHEFITKPENSCGSMTWESVTYACLLKAATFFRTDFLFMHVLQILVASVTCAYGFQVGRRLGRPKTAAFVILLAVLLPINGLMIVSSERDILFAWLASG